MLLGCEIVSSINKLIGVAKILLGKNMNYTTNQILFNRKIGQVSSYFPHGDTDTNMYLERYL